MKLIRLIEAEKPLISAFVGLEPCSFDYNDYDEDTIPDYDVLMDMQKEELKQLRRSVKSAGGVLGVPSVVFDEYLDEDDEMLESVFYLEFPVSATLEALMAIHRDGDATRIGKSAEWIVCDSNGSAPGDPEFGVTPP